jgi:c-di-GMP-binding flagellar brake protein YcgR
MEQVRQDTKASQRFELSGAADLDRYMLYTPAEILHLLSAIAHRSTLLTLYFDSGNQFILTTVLTADESAAILDYGAREDLNRRVLTSAKLVFITTHDKVKVQWISGRAERVNYGGRPAFRIATPHALLRLQRREYYRLTVPIAKPLVCRVHMVREEVELKLELSVTDISLGGIAVMGPPQHAAFEIGKSYADCELQLPGVGTLMTTLAVCNMFEVTARDGTRSTRCGFRFIDLPGATLAVLQRYINKVEHERHERIARLA